MPVQPFGLFSVEDMTNTLNSGDIAYGEVSASGIFGTAKPLSGRVALIEKGTRTFRVATSAPLGSVGETLERDLSDLRYIPVPHFPAHDHIDPQDVQGLRQAGVGNVLLKQKLAPHVGTVLRSHRTRFEITKEAMMCGALQGIVRDGAGRTLFNAFTEFGIAQPTHNIDIADNLQISCMDLSRKIEDDMLEDVMSGVDVWCSRTYFDHLLTMPMFREVFLSTEKALQQLGTDARKTGITFGGVKFREYAGQARNAAGAKQRFITEGEALAVPSGTRNTFSYYAAPPDFNETINVPATSEYFAKMEEGKFGRGYDIHSQFNILPVCLNPSVLYKLTKTV